MRFCIQGIYLAAFLAFATSSEAQARGLGAVRGGGRGAVAVGPHGSVAVGARGGSYTGARGTTVTAGGRGAVAVGPAGGVHAAGSRGAVVTNPGGRNFATGSRGVVTTRPAGSVRITGAHAAGYGSPYGGVAVGGRTGVVVRPGGSVAVGHSTRYISRSTLQTQGAYIRGGYRYSSSYFTPAWYRGHSAAWVAPRWAVRNIWYAPPWRSVAGYCGITAQPIVYDYGSTVVYQDNRVYVNGDSVGTAEQYSQQALDLAEQGRAAKFAKEEEWQPLGVFGLVQGDEKVANNIFQLAVNKEGVIRGNYYDALSDSNLPVSGMVDKKSQRAVWSIGDKKDIVYEAGLYNLAQDESTLLIHYGKERTQQMTLVRLEGPKEE